MTDTEQVTILQYVEHLNTLDDDRADEQLLIDAALKVLLEFKGAPRIYEVVRDEKGRASLVWVLRSMEDWSRIILDGGMQQIVRHLRHRLRGEN